MQAILTNFDTQTVLFAFCITLAAGLATGLGGLIAVLRGRPGPVFTAAALGFSAGVMIYVSFVDIMPKATDSLAKSFSETQATWIVVGGFFAGIALIAIIDRFVPEPINPHEPEELLDAAALATRRRMMKMGTMTALAIGIHNFPEGFATFVAALDDVALAVPVAVAIAIHNIPEGIAVAVPLQQATGSRKKALTWSLLSGLAEPAGALVGFLLLMPFLGPVAMGVAFAMVGGVMVFISLDKLLPTAQATGKHHAAIYGVIAGMAVMALSLLLFL